MPLYSRKRRPKRGFGQRKRLLRQLPSRPADSVASYSRVGNGNFVDSAIVGGYSWSRQVPLAQPPVCEGKLMSLKEICQAALCKQVSDLDVAHLDSASWLCWHGVWRQVLLLRLDSFHACMIFSSRFASMAGFSPHLPRSINHSSLRDLAADNLRVPGAFCHRLEIVHRNIDFSKVSAYLRQFSGTSSPLILIDASALALDRGQIFLLLHIPNLAALNLSRNAHIDDSFLRNVGAAMSADGKLRSLVALQLDHCPNITRDGLLSLLAVVSKSSCSLSLIQSDINLGKPGASGYLSNSKWKALDPRSPDSKLFTVLPLGLKINAVHHYLALGTSGSNRRLVCPLFRDLVVFDIFVDGNVSSMQSDAEAAWSHRNQQRYRDVSQSGIYIVNQKRTISEPTVTDRGKQQPFRGKKRITVDASTFFGK